MPSLDDSPADPPNPSQPVTWGTGSAVRPKKQPLPGWLWAVIAGTLLAIMGISTYAIQRDRAVDEARVAEYVANLEAENTVEGDAGYIPDAMGLGFGTYSQAAMLLDLLGHYPGRDTYQVTYRTDADTVLVGFTLSEGVLIRIHTRPDGHGTAETWIGFPVDRLRSAVEGGPLESTPEGYDSGFLDRF